VTSRTCRHGVDFLLGQTTAWCGPGCCQGVARLLGFGLSDPRSYRARSSLRRPGVARYRASLRSHTILLVMSSSVAACAGPGFGEGAEDLGHAVSGELASEPVVYTVGCHVGRQRGPRHPSRAAAELAAALVIDAGRNAHGEAMLAPCVRSDTCRPHVRRRQGWLVSLPWRIPLRLIPRLSTRRLGTCGVRVAGCRIARTTLRHGWRVTASAWLPGAGRLSCTR